MASFTLTMTKYQGNADLKKRNCQVILELALSRDVVRDDSWDATPGSPSGCGAAQWAERRPSLTGPGFSLQNHNLEAVMSTTILAGGWGGQRQGDYEFKVILGY